MNKKCKKGKLPCCEMVGIYGIHNKRTDKWYIGAATNIHSRLVTHERNIRLHGGINCKMYSDMNTPDEMEYIVLETFEDNTINAFELMRVERRYMDKYNSLNNGYNVQMFAGFGNTNIYKPIVPKRNYEYITLEIEHGALLALEKFANNLGYNVEDYILRAIRKTIQKDNMKK